MNVNAGVEHDGSGDQSNWRDPRDDGSAPPLSGFPLQARIDQQNAGICVENGICRAITQERIPEILPSLPCTRRSRGFNWTLRAQLEA